MNQLDGITVSNIAEIITIRAPRGRRMKIANRGFFGLSFCTSGKITYSHGGKSFVSKPGVAVILPMHAAYELYNNEGGEFPLINFYCAGKGFTDEFICIPLGKDDVYIKDYERMKSLSFSESNRLAVLGVFYEILSRLSSEDKNSAGVLNPALEYIAENFCSQEISNTAIAEYANISEVYFRKLFREKYHTTPRQYILEMRVKKAKQLLAETRQSVADISVLCGFSGVYHFCRAFKQRVGLTPTEYRSVYEKTAI